MRRSGRAWTWLNMNEDASSTSQRIHKSATGKSIFILKRHSWVLIPGTPLLPTGFLAVIYFLILVWLFMGIAIVSDIFMEGIEKITS